MNDTERQSVIQRLNSFREIKHGWLDGYGSESGIKKCGQEICPVLIDLLIQRMSNEMPKPNVFPTPSGGVQLDWSFGSYYAELEIFPDGRDAEWFELNRDTDEDSYEEIQIDDQEELWKRIVERLGFIVRNI